MRGLALLTILIAALGAAAQTTVEIRERELWFGTDANTIARARVP